MRLFALLAALAAAAGPALAAECPLERAVYREPAGWRLVFHPVPPEDALGVSNAFTLRAPGEGLVLDGAVVWGSGFTRPIGRLQLGCPETPAYEEEDGCTLWRGIVYGVTTGEVDLIGDADAPAPERLVLANLGQILNYSMLTSEAGRLGVEIGDMPWDVFELAGCAP